MWDSLHRGTTTRESAARFVMDDSISSKRASSALINPRCSSLRTRSESCTPSYAARSIQFLEKAYHSPIWGRRDRSTGFPGSAADGCLFSPDPSPSFSAHGHQHRNGGLFGSYARRVGDLEGVRRTALAAIELHIAQIDGGDIPAALAASPLRKSLLPMSLFCGTPPTAPVHFPRPRARRARRAPDPLMPAADAGCTQSPATSAPARVRVTRFLCRATTSSRSSSRTTRIPALADFCRDIEDLAYQSQLYFLAQATGLPGSSCRTTPPHGACGPARSTRMPEVPRQEPLPGSATSTPAISGPTRHSTARSARHYGPRTS